VEAEAAAAANKVAQEEAAAAAAAEKARVEAEAAAAANKVAQEEVAAAAAAEKARVEAEEAAVGLAAAAKKAANEKAVAAAAEKIRLEAEEAAAAQAEEARKNEQGFWPAEMKKLGQQRLGTAIKHEEVTAQSPAEPVSLHVAKRMYMGDPSKQELEFTKGDKITIFRKEGARGWGRHENNSEGWAKMSLLRFLRTVTESAGDAPRSGSAGATSKTLQKFTSSESGPRCAAKTTTAAAMDYGTATDGGDGSDDSGSDYDAASENFAVFCFDVCAVAVFFNRVPHSKGVAKQLACRRGRAPAISCLAPHSRWLCHPICAQCAQYQYD
jgi:hypothetical protein